MLCSAGSGLQWFSCSLHNLLGTFCNWSWHSTQRAPWLMPFTSQFVSSASSALPAPLHNKSAAEDRDDSGARAAVSSLDWNQCFSVAGRTLSSPQGFSNTTRIYLLPLPHRRAAIKAAWIIAMRSLRSLWLLLLWLPPQQTHRDFYTLH